MAVMGLAALTMTKEASKATGLNLDPRVEITSWVAPYIKEELQYRGNECWQREIKEQNKDTKQVDFKRAYLKKETDDWQVVKYTDWQTYFKNKAKYCKK